MTHPPGGGGGSNGGQTGPGRAVDRVMAHLDAAYDRTMTRLGAAIFRGDRVDQADARTSYMDLRAAAAMHGLGLSPDEIDRNGVPLRAVRGNPHPQPSNPQTPPPPR